MFDWFGHSIRRNAFLARMASNSIYNLFGAATSRIAFLLGTFLLAKYLGPESFGKFSISYTTATVAGVFMGLGFGSTATKYIAQFLVERPKDVGAIVSLINRFTLLTILILSGLLFYFSEILAVTFFGSSVLSVELKFGFVLAALVTIRGLQAGILAGFQSFKIIAKLNILEGLASFGLLLIGGFFWGPSGAIVGCVVAAFLTNLIGKRCINSVLRDHEIIVGRRDGVSAYSIMSNFALPNFLANVVAAPILWYAISEIYKSPGGEVEVGIYNAAYQWHGPLVFIPTLVVSSSIPVLVKLWSEGDYINYRKAGFFLFAMAALVGGLPAVILSLMSNMIGSAYGDAYIGFNDIFVFLIFAAPFHAISKVGTTLLLAKGRAWYVFVLNSFWVFSMLIMIELQIFGAGAIGVSRAIFYSYFLLSLMMLWVVVFGLNGGQNKRSV